MIEVSSFLSGKNLCNVFADLIVKKIDELTPDAKTQITVVNVRNFFIVKGITTSENIVNLSECLSSLFESYDSELINKVRVIDTILYNKEFELNVKVSHKESKNQNKVVTNLMGLCNDLQKEGYYITVKINNGILFYDFEHEKDFNPTHIKEKFSNYICIKDDFSQDIYTSENIYGLSNHSLKYYYCLVNKISFNLLSRDFSKTVDLLISSEFNVNEIDSENVKLKINNKSIIDNLKLESLILDNFNFTLSELKKEFNLNDFNVLECLSNRDIKYPWENHKGTSDFILL